MTRNFGFGFFSIHLITTSVGDNSIFRIIDLEIVEQDLHKIIQINQFLESTEFIIFDWLKVINECHILKSVNCSKKRMKWLSKQGQPTDFIYVLFN